MIYHTDDVSQTRDLDPDSDSLDVGCDVSRKCIELVVVVYTCEFYQNNDAVDCAELRPQLLLFAVALNVRISR